MKYKQPILKLASILLIVVLTQKMVGGLYLHNWLHGSKSISLHSPDEKVVAQYNCSCIDDFYVPFTPATPIVVETPSRVQAVFFVSPDVSLPIVTKFFHALRGPPVS